MKKTILVLLTMFAITASYSQTEQGKMFTGGQISFLGNSETQFDSLYKYRYNSNGIIITPQFGYFLKDNFAIGANILLQYSNIKRTDEKSNVISNTNKSIKFGYGIGGFVRYYSEITEKFKFFFNGGIDYQYSKEKQTQTSNLFNRDYETNHLTLYFSPGLVYFITPKLGIQSTFGNLYFMHSVEKNKVVTYNNNNYGLNINSSSITFGFSYYF